MNKVLGLFLLINVNITECLIIGRTTFGNYDDSIYIRNKYYWADTLTILPISVNDAKIISSGWRSICLVSNISNDKFYKFDSSLNQNSNEFFKRVEDDENIVNALISTEIDCANNVIHVKEILKNPYISNIKTNDIVEDLGQLAIKDAYKNFKIEFNLF